MTTNTFPVGTQVVLRHDIDRYPHFIAKAGMVGVVVDVGDPQIAIAVRFNEPIPGAEDWENEVHWYADGGSDEDYASDLRVL